MPVSDELEVEPAPSEGEVRTREERLRTSLTVAQALFLLARVGQWLWTVLGPHHH